MKFPKLSKLFKKKYIVIYVIVFLLIASVLVFYFYGSLREGALTKAESQYSPEVMETNAKANVTDSILLGNLITSDIKSANIQVGSSLTGNILSKVQSELDTITAEKLKNQDYSKYIDKDQTKNYASKVQNNYGGPKNSIPGCDLKAEQRKKAADPNYKIIPCPVTDESATKPGNVMKQYVH